MNEGKGTNDSDSIAKIHFLVSYTPGCLPAWLDSIPFLIKIYPVNLHIDPSTGGIKMMQSSGVIILKVLDKHNKSHVAFLRRA